jgi:hypothetical protein
MLPRNAETGDYAELESPIYRREKELSWTMARPPHQRSRGMSDITLDHTENAPLNTEISDEVLEGAASAGHAGAYTQFAYCTSIGCPGSPRLDPAPREIP